MSRKPKKGKKGGPTEVAATTLLMPPTKTITDLAKLKASTKRRSSSASGEYGTAVKDAVEKRHLDRKALAIVMAMNAIEDDHDFGVTFFHVLRYMDDLDFNKRATKQKELFEPVETGPGLKDAKNKKNAKNSEAKSGDGDDKVVPIGAAARKVAEAAGEPVKTGDAATG